MGMFQNTLQRGRNSKAAASEIFSRLTDENRHNIVENAKNVALFGGLFILSKEIQAGPLSVLSSYFLWHVSSALLTGNIVERGQQKLERRLRRPVFRKSFYFKLAKLFTAANAGPALIFGGMGLVTLPLHSAHRIESPGAYAPDDPARPVGRVEGRIVLPNGVTIKTADRASRSAKPIFSTLHG